jgi:hypothetical protein
VNRLQPIALFAALAAAPALTAALLPEQAPRTDTRPSADPAPEVTAAVLRRAGTDQDAMPGAWLSYGRTQGETRYQPALRRSTPQREDLGLAWTYVMGAGGGNQEGTPLVWNNTLYGITTWSVVFASTRAPARAVAMGSAGRSAERRARDLLRQRQSRHRPLQRNDHRTVDRWSSVRAQCADRKASVGNAHR